MVMQRKNHTRLFWIIAMAMILAAVFAQPVLVHAEQSGEGSEPKTEKAEKTVRVGWHEEPFFITDQYGRNSGYTYDYQRKVAAYTGWKYEYVKGGWSELLKMLKDGDIDMLGNVSYTEERAKVYQFPSLPMGTDTYYLFISPDNTDIRSEDYSSLNGKKVGVAKDSVQSGMLQEWAKEHHITPRIVEMTCTEDESLQRLGTELDALVTMDIHGSAQSSVPLWKIGSSDFFFAINKDRSDLLADLNDALNRIQEENSYFTQELYEKYLNNNETNRFLTDDEKGWLKKHGTIRVGYQDNYLAFCAQDPSTGELTGALKDYLDYASTGLANAKLSFEPVCYPSAEEALDALKKGEIDCMFPANLTEYDSEELGVLMSPALMTTEMDAVVREADQKEFAHKKEVIVTVNKGNTNYEMFLADHFPDWKIKHYDDTQQGMEAIAAGQADCVLISNYRYSNIARECERLHLTTVYTGVDMDYCLALREGDSTFYSILAKVTTTVPNSVINSALNYYSTEDVKTSLLDNIKEHLVSVLLVILAIVLVIMGLLLRSNHLRKKAEAEEKVIQALNRKVNVDALTSVRNKGAYNEYMQSMQQKLENGEISEFAIGVFDCDDLKSVNDQCGHDKGDIYLQTATRLICRVFDHSPVFRTGGDEFAVILLSSDFQNRQALVSQFDKEKDEINASTENTWEQVHVALGIAVYDPEIDHSIDDTARRADKIMYENKRLGKEYAKA